MMRKWSFRLLFMALVLLIGIASFTPACEYSRDVTIENGSRATLVIFCDNTKIATLEPGEKVIREFALTPEEWLISAKDLSGNTVYSKRWTVDELSDSHWKVVITPLE